MRVPGSLLAKAADIKIRCLRHPPKPLGMGLDEKAVEVVRTWRFKPGVRNGIAVAVRVLVEVSFRLF